MPIELGVIGAGNMAEAIVRGVIGAKLFSPAQILIADVSESRRRLFQDELGVRAGDSNADVARQAKTILLSVKPQQMQQALAEMRDAVSVEALVVSIAAGISSGFIENSLGADRCPRVVRSMPNTPMLIGAGMTAISKGTNATNSDLATARRIFESAGLVIEVEESKLDAVTAVSGSGPAYFFYLVEQMIAAGVELGLGAEDARLLASQTALGAGKMLAESGDSPQVLRQKVTSPGGTTHAAISHLENNNAATLIRQALHAAAQRSRELGK